MKKIIHYFLPLIFALLLFLFYIIIYPLTSPVDSENVSTALLVSFTGMGVCAVVIFSGQKNKRLFYCYFLVSIGFPLILLLFFNLFETVQLKILLGCHVIGLFWLKFFVSAYLKQRRSKG
jgi:hypothetical protein